MITSVVEPEPEPDFLAGAGAGIATGIHGHDFLTKSITTQRQ